ncbi:MAG: hypothetical protein AAGC60_28530 [Acidobacteriota bacterium]
MSRPLLRYPIPISRLPSRLAKVFPSVVLLIAVAAVLSGLSALSPRASAQETAAQEVQEPPPQSDDARARDAAPPEAVVPQPGSGTTLRYEPDPDAVDAAQGAAADEAAPTTSTRETVRARLTSDAAPGHRWVRSVRRWRSDAGRPSWSRQGHWIVYDRVGDRGRRVLMLGQPDAPVERCLSCDLHELRDDNVLHAAWHPSGEVLVAVVQRMPRRLHLDAGELAGVEGLLRTELWAVHRDGRDAWQLTRAGERGATAGPPAFSYEGDRLAWSERADSTAGGPWGDWDLQVAEFRLRRGLPRLGGVDTFDAMPWAGVLSVDAFTVDDRGVLVTAAAPPQQRAAEGRLGGPAAGTPATLVGSYGFDDRRLQVLAEAGRWERDLAQVPRGERLIFASDRGLAPPRFLPARHDLWLATPSGRSQERLTFFNDPDAPDSLGEAMIGGIAWGPDGERLLVHVLWLDSEAIAGDDLDLEAIEPSEAIYLITFDPAIHGGA